MPPRQPTATALPREEVVSGTLYEFDMDRQQTTHDDIAVVKSRMSEPRLGKQYFEMGVTFQHACFKKE